MKIISYRLKTVKNDQIGVIQDHTIYNLNGCFGDINVIDLIQIDRYETIISDYLLNGDTIKHSPDEVISLPAVPHPTSIRDAYAFR